MSMGWRGIGIEGGYRVGLRWRCWLVGAVRGWMVALVEVVLLPPPLLSHIPTVKNYRFLITVLLKEMKQRMKPVFQFFLTLFIFPFVHLFYTY